MSFLKKLFKKTRNTENNVVVPSKVVDTNKIEMPELKTDFFDIKKECTEVGLEISDPGRLGALESEIAQKTTRKELWNKITAYIEERDSGYCEFYSQVGIIQFKKDAHFPFSYAYAMHYGQTGEWGFQRTPSINYKNTENKFFEKAIDFSINAQKDLAYSGLGVKLFTEACLLAANNYISLDKLPDAKRIAKIGLSVINDADLKRIASM